jgi:hypothetical protein
MARLRRQRAAFATKNVRERELYLMREGIR